MRNVRIFIKKNKIKVFAAFITILVIILFFIVQKVIDSTSSSAPTRFWPVEAVDTVKYSRDLADNPEIYKYIPILVREAAALHITHIALGTPYDEQFYPVLKAWVLEARRYNLHIWFRGNFSGWEGWFGYPKFSDVNEHHALTKAFILKHPDLFEDGDIFTPAPEPENGGFGDPRESDSKAAAYNSFLVASYTNCLNSFAQIHKNVTCGYFSMNGDIANNVLTPQTVSQIGNVVVIDHYVDSPDAMDRELTTLEQRFPTAKIVLGEFGAPIPDINGNMTDSEQADFIASLFKVFYTHRSRVAGIDYWTLAGGSTSLLSGSFTPLPAFDTVSHAYGPVQIQGKVTDGLGNPFANIKITDSNGNTLASTNGKGFYSFPVFSNQSVTMVISIPTYLKFEKSFTTQNQNIVQDIKLSPNYPSFFYNLRLFFAHVFLF